MYVYPDDFALTPWLVVDYDGVDVDPASGRVHALVSDHRGAPVLALDAARIIVAKGNRRSDPGKQCQVFERRMVINGRRDRVRVIVDSDNGNNVVTMFPVRSE